MDTWVWVVVAILVAAAILAVVAVWFWRGLAVRRRRSARLKATFGPEYDETVSRLGRRRGEDDLEARQARVAQLDIQPLPVAEVERFVTAWTATQARFVDEPGAALDDADRLVTEVMQLRGYPADDFERRAADASVTHPDVVTSYRSAHATALANASGDATTEELRQAMIQYRALFRELVVSSRDDDLRRSA